MPDESRTPTDQTQPPKTGAGGPNRPQPAFDAEDAKRAAAAALTVGQASLRAAWRRGKEAAAARGVTEETIRQTVERGRAVAQEQARRRGLGRSDLPTWPGSTPSASSGKRTGSTTSERPRAAAGPRPAAGSDAGPAAEAKRSTGPRSAPFTPARGAGLLRSAVPTRLLGAAGIGRARGKALPAALPNRAPLDRRVAAFALDLVAFAAAFVVLVFVADLLAGVVAGNAPATGGEPLGLSWGNLLRVLTFRELGDAVSGAPDWGPLAVQAVYLVGFGVYMIGAEARFGQTVGKRALGLRVVPSRRAGKHVGLERAAIRNVCRVYDLLIPLWPLLLFDLAVVALSPNRQRSGDWFAGTVVVDERVGG